MTSICRTAGTRGTVAGRRAAAHVAAAFALASVVAPPSASAASVPFKQVRMIIEYNASAEDVGVQFFLDSDGWKSVKIFAPSGEQVFSAAAQSRLLRQGGGTELFVESVEPELGELPLDRFFERFPEGRYRFAGLTPEGDSLFGSDRFTHKIPAGPEVVLPGPGEECAEGVAIPATISWLPVAETILGGAVTIVGYEVIVERGGNILDVRLPATASEMTVPAEFLHPGADYLFEVLAIEASGNQTITEGCFSTAN